MIISDSFILDLKREGDIITISDQLVLKRLDIEVVIACKGVVIKGCVFKEAVAFTNMNFNCGVKFIGCKFEKELSFISCISDPSAHDLDLYINNIEISGTYIDTLKFSGANQIERGVELTNKSVVNKLYVDSLCCSNGSFSISNSTVEQNVNLKKCRFHDSFTITNNCIINAAIKLENIDAGGISFLNSTFTKSIYIWAGELVTLTFNNGVFEDNLKITAVPVNGMLTIIGTEYKKAVIFNIKDDGSVKIGSLHKIHIASAKFGEEFVINGNNSEIDMLDIRLSKLLSGSLFFRSCNVLKAKMSGDNYNSNIVFNLCSFNNLSFNYFYNYSTISIISAKSYGDNSELSIDHSNLGKTHFFNMFFNTFKFVTIYNSALTEIVTSNVKWFNPINLNTFATLDSYGFVQKKEIYRQLKFALEKQGDRIESLKFKSFEMKAYQQELFSSPKWYAKIFSIDRFVLWLGQTNNFGLNWFKPVILILCFGFLFYCLIIIGVSDSLAYSFNFSSHSFSTTFLELWRYIDALPQLMNPIHSLDRVFVKGEKLGFGAHFFDYTLKVFLAFFIFQIISAFRKYMK